MNEKSNFNNTLEYILIILFFLISLINVPLLILSVIVSMLLLKQKESGLIKLLYLYTIRFVISEGIDHAESEIIITIIRYFLIYICGTILVLSSYKFWSKNKVISAFITSTGITMLLLGIPSLIVSDYPFIAIFKMLSYFIPLLIIVILISQIKNFKELVMWLANQFKFLILFSLLFVRSSIGYLLNGFSFQGILNHPNLFAVVLAMGLVVIILSLYYERKNLSLNFIILIIGSIELLISNSRTAVLSYLLCIFIFFVLAKIDLYKKALIFLIGLLITVGAIMIPSIQSKIFDFIAKGQTSNNVLLSRYGQINNFELSLKKYPLFGNGFGIPINNTSLSLNNYTFEAGNMIFGLIIFTGIIGLTIYFIYLFSFIFMAKKPFRLTIILLLVTILVNMGEMIMFSSTNVGIICYILWGIYFKEGVKTENEEYIQV